jgi:aminoglycoside 6-adenylyltransferase
VTDRYAILIARITAWADGDENIRALVVTGSAARGPAATDRFSDRDIEIIAHDRRPLLASDAWLHAFAPVWVAQALANNDAFDTRLVFFAGGRKIDFTIADRTRIEVMIRAGRLDDLYQRGYDVLLDKDGLTADLPRPTGEPPRRSLPTAAELAETVTEFWFEAAHMPAYLLRGELWVVKFRDWTMKQMLLRMVEWHALATNGPLTDVWHIGTRMERWVDAQTWGELQHVFGRFDRADSWRSLVATMRLFTRLTRETAERLDLAYPIDSERAITHYVLSFADEIAPHEAETTPRP